jgi:RimJ/RimL family protein N-acetyltransferase
MPSKRIIFENERVGQWVCARTGGLYDAASTSIGLCQNGEIIAGVLFDQYNGRSACMHVAAVPGARWMTKGYLWVCFDYPFNQLKLNKILGLVDSTNLPARRFDEHLGFQLECCVKDAGRDGDLLIYTMTKQQCRHLNMEHTYGRQILSTSST